MLSGVQIGTDGNPSLRRNQIHDNKGCGILVWEGGLGVVEDNDITSNGNMGVEIRTGGNPTFRGNRINRNVYRAVWIHDDGRGVMKDNDLTGNSKGAWLIAEDSKANVTRARNKD